MKNDKIAAFTGSVPANYDRYMGPMFFEPYAADLADRIPITAASVLEIACGTGIATRAVRARLGSTPRLVATDLNEAMIDQARHRFDPGERVEFRQADAMSLPFGDGEFDAAVCQFGVMFFPDKATAFADIFRVLGPGGTFHFNVWGRLEDNELSNAVQEAVDAYFKTDAPQFYRDTPFGFHDAELIRALLVGAGFRDVAHEWLKLPSVAGSPEDAVKGLVDGTPLAGQVRELGGEEALAGVRGAVEEEIRRRFPIGESPITTEMKALVCSAVKPRLG
jgi:ubiquinone/menaquinone biosynthesis C-methylase UbiE